MTDAELARAAGIRVRMLRAIRAVESNGHPAAIRFEPNLFRRARPDIAREIPYTGPGPSKVRAETDRGAFEHAFRLDADAAVRATSFGLFQVLGGHLIKLYGSPVAGLDAFDADPAGVSARLLASWMHASHAAQHAANAEPPDFAGFARLWNGPGNVAHYSARLAEEYARAQP